MPNFNNLTGELLLLNIEVKKLTHIINKELTHQPESNYLKSVIIRNINTIKRKLYNIQKYTTE